MRVFRATDLLARVSTIALACALYGSRSEAHTVSIGYAFVSPGTVNLWYGSYHNTATFNEADVQLVGPSFNQTVAYTLLSGTKPAGLVDGVNNFYSNTAGTALVGVPEQVASTDGSGGAFNPATQSVLNWQGATFSGLRPGTYTFTYNPLGAPTVEWHPINDVIRTGTFTLTASDVLGIDGYQFYGTNDNQRNVGTGLDNAINGGAFNQTIYNIAALPPDAMANALTQISGEPLTQVSTSGFQSMNGFLAAMLDPWSGAGDQRGGDFGAAPGALPGGGFGGDPYGSAPYGGAPYGSGDPYGANPYGGAPYGGDPYGSAPYGSSPYGGAPYGSSPYGTSTYGNLPYGNSQNGNSQYGNSQYGNSPYGSSSYGNGPNGNARSDSNGQSRSWNPFARDPRCEASPDRRVWNKEPCWSVWVSPYGAYGRLTGDGAIGSHDTSLRSGGMIAGLDYRFATGSVIGAAMTAGTTSWGLADSLGGGRSDTFQAGLYGSQRFKTAYLSAAVAFGLQQVSTSRTITVSGSDQLSGNFWTHGFGARVEFGNRFAYRDYGVTPYAAGQIQYWWLPAYSENVVNGSGDFALAVDARKANDTRTELGLWIDRKFETDSGRLLVRGRAAWMHDFGNAPMIMAAFQTMPNSNFTVSGAAPQSNAALLSLAAELRLADGWSLAGKLDGELAPYSQTFTATSTLRFRW